jgi:hypothetical protein
VRFLGYFETRRQIRATESYMQEIQGTLYCQASYLISVCCCGRADFAPPSRSFVAFKLVGSSAKVRQGRNNPKSSKSKCPPFELGIFCAWIPVFGDRNCCAQASTLITSSKTPPPPSPAETISPPLGTPPSARTAGSPAAALDASDAASRDTRHTPAHTPARRNGQRCG